MPARRVISALFITIVLVALAHPAAAQVQFSSASYQDALAAASADGKFVFIDFYTTWCGPCKRLEEVTYRDSGVAGLLSDVVCLKFDAENGAGVDLADTYRVSAYPTLVLLGSDGNEIDRHIGYLDPGEFVQVFGDYRRGVNTVEDYRRRVAENPDDAESWKVLGMKHADAARHEEAKAALNRYLELRPDLPGEEKAEILARLAFVYYDSEAYEEAKQAYQQILDEFPDTDHYDDALTWLARTYHKLGLVDDCIETYMKYVDRHPGDVGAMNSFAWFCASRKVGLDAALPVALEAAELSNRSPGILDTLAELYYARGEFDEAITVGAEALEKDPEDQYLADQLKKFKAAREHVGS